MTTLHAQPYDISKTGFYFESLEDYEAKVAASQAEEFELQFIDGDNEDAQLFSACGINQANLSTWFDTVEILSDFEKAALYYLCSEVGYRLEDALDKIEDVSLFDGRLIDAAIELFDDCYLSEVPEFARNYIDYDAFARDCEMGGDMREFEFAGSTYTVTNHNAI